MSKYYSQFSGMLLVAFCSLAVAEEHAIDFNRDVRPILSDKCYFCHGPDSENREADLRLDTSEGSADVIASGELISRITSDDPYMAMPPEGSNLSLAEVEKETLQAWVQSGAEYDRHWSFKELPDDVTVPKPERVEWPRHSLDYFVLAKLKAEGLEPTKEASPLRWLRRVTFDLTGLPPTLQEVVAFEDSIKQQPETAYEEVVERLLAAPAYGEHMAIAWLEAARFADSYGYQSDQLNMQWPYRDWVVEAFNSNLPFDQFITWQLAGDLLENPTREQRLATAFNRLHRLTNEGGAVSEEWRQENVSDRVHTFGTAVLGLTLECCRCHDHKYDPILSRDYYSISAFFNSIDENGLYDHTDKVPSPSMLLPTVEQELALAAVRKKLAEAESAYADAMATVGKRYMKWRHGEVNSQGAIPNLVIALDFDQPFEKAEKDVYFPCTGNRSKTGDLERVVVEDSEIPGVESHSEVRRAILFDGERGISIKEIKPLDRWMPFSLVVTLKDPKRDPLRSVIAQHTQGTDVGYNGWDLTIEDGYVESRMYRVWPGNGFGIRTVEQIPQDQWQQVAATYDGSSQAAGLKLYLNGRELVTKVLRNDIVKCANTGPRGKDELVLGQRFRGKGFTKGLIDDVRFYDRALCKTELIHLATGEPLELTLDYFASASDIPCRTALSELAVARQELATTEESIHEVPVMAELSEPRPAHILARGQYDAPTSDETLVKRGVFSDILPEFPAEAPLDRLGLAKWVVAPNHPLTSRVLVNRLWQNFFGAGLVRTPENFGLQGELPTHPELLDWLARDLIESGWDVKRFCKNVVLSATYCQDSTAEPELAAKDPDNRFLARGPAYRLAAEQIRDLALAASGLLNREQGGPPVSPYQAGGDLWRESNAMSPAYQQSVGRALYRRSLYSVWKRTAPLPNMMAFDTNSRETCMVNRSRTNTPLQALVLLNDVQFVEASRKLAEQVLQQSADDKAQIEYAFVAFAGRKPDSVESEILLELLEEERLYYASHAEEAQKLVHLGEAGPSGNATVSEAAAMTVVCQAILNLDASIWKR